MDLEEIAVSKVVNAISKTDQLVPYIKSKEKGIITDGEIAVYNNVGDIHSNENLEGSVPVQIKGRRMERPYPDKISFSVEISSLKEFLRKAGCIFFVVYVDKSGTNEQIFYKVLLPYDLRQILKGYENQKTKVIRLSPFPTLSSEITNIFLNFINDRNKQYIAISSDILSIEDFTKAVDIPEIYMGVKISNPEKDSPVKYIMNHGAYIYAKGVCNLDFPIAHIESFQKLIANTKRDVIVGKKVYYKTYKYVQDVDGNQEIRIGKSNIFKVESGTDNIVQKFSLKGSLSERIQDLSFAIDIIDKKGFMIGESDVELETEFLSDDFYLKFNRNKEYLQSLCIAQEVLNKLHVQNELEMDNMSEKDYQNLDLLISSVYYGEEVSLNVKENSIGYINIANLCIIILADKNVDTGLYRIKDFFAPSLRITNAERDNVEELSAPSFTMLTHEDILKCSNLSLDVIMDQLNEGSYNEFCAERVNIFLLEVLLAYDQSNDNKGFMEIAKWLMKKICKEDHYTPYEILRLNELQMLKRCRGLRAKEKKELKEMAICCEDEEILTGIYLLLEDQKNASIHYEKLSPDQQTEFSRYPIFKYWRKDTYE